MREKKEESAFMAALQGLDEAIVDWLLDVVSFANEIHKGQVRGASGELAVCHLLRVGKMAVDEFQKDRSFGEEFVAAGILHDSLEDTNINYEELAERFGSEVARLVSALTHEYEEEPEQINLGRVASGGRKAIILKRLDKIDNVSRLGDTTPEFRAKKLAELEMEFLPLWRNIDPTGAESVERIGKEVAR